MAWVKTFGQKASGTNTSVSSPHLNDSGASFITAGVKALMIVRNATDATWTYVAHRTAGSNPVAATQLILAAHIFTATAKAYNVYATPFLPPGFVECNGQTLSDAESPFNGLVIPDLNSGSNRFLRGSLTSGTTGGAATHSHTVNSHDHTLGSHTHTVPSHTHSVTPAGTSFCVGAGGICTVGDDTAVTTSGTSLTTDAASGNTGTAAPGTDSISNLPPYYEVVHVMRVK